MKLASMFLILLFSFGLAHCGGQTGQDCTPTLTASPDASADVSTDAEHDAGIGPGDLPLPDAFFGQ